MAVRALSGAAMPCQPRQRTREAKTRAIDLAARESAVAGGVRIGGWRSCRRQPANGCGIVEMKTGSRCGEREYALDTMRERAVDLSLFGLEFVFAQMRIQQRAQSAEPGPKHAAGDEAVAFDVRLRNAKARAQVLNSVAICPPVIADRLQVALGTHQAQLRVGVHRDKNPLRALG